MKKVLVIGGAGTFGARVLRLLAETGQFHLLIAGRDLAKAERVRASLPDATIDIRRFDRKGNVMAQLADIAPWAVIDAAGPFQDDSAARYAVPQACIQQGIHYVDLADSRAFVTGISDLDAAARAANVTVLAGASTVPALSTAIVDALASELKDIASIDIALSASNRATAGPNVNAAILSYVGQPIRYRAAGLWPQGFGWQKLAKKSFAVTGRQTIAGRLVGLCDVPDLDLLPLRFPQVGNVIFRAGAELPIQNIILWLLSFIVRWRGLKSLSPFAALFNRLQALGGFLGSDRSAMAISVTGRDRAGAMIEAGWTLIAEDGHGPWVPSFAATLLVRKLAMGEIPAGAGPAIGVLGLSDFIPLFAQFHLFTETRRIVLPPSLYARVLGAAFDSLPKPVQAIHAFGADAHAAGRGEVRRGHDPIARLLGWAFRFPPAQKNVPVTVIFGVDRAGEIWRRDFGGHCFRSRLATREKGSRTILTETFWPLTFDFDLHGHDAGLDMDIRAWRLLGLPLPKFLAPRISAMERVADGHFTFDVRIALPWGPLIVHYAGWLRHISPAHNPVISQQTRGVS